jgi:nicotinamide riboside transporter PnuC
MDPNVRNVIEIANQVCLFVFGLVALILVFRKNKWGTVFGLISQIFWYTAAIMSEQWGILLLNVCYTAVWGYGFWEWFIKKPPKPD